MVRQGVAAGLNLSGLSRETLVGKSSQMSYGLTSHLAAGQEETEGLSFCIWDSLIKVAVTSLENLSPEMVSQPQAAFLWGLRAPAC